MLIYSTAFLNVIKNFSVRMQTHEGPIFQLINSKLREHIKPSHIEILNESYKHNVPKNSETHFRVLLVSEKFENLTIMKRHQLVYAALKDEMNNVIHALSIVAKTPLQWEESNKQIGSSPPCLGGSKK